MVSFVMLIPHVIYILGVNWAQKLSIVVGMDINRLFNTYGYNVKSIILLIVVFDKAVKDFFGKTLSNPSSAGLELVDDKYYIDRISIK